MRTYLLLAAATIALVGCSSTDEPIAVPGSGASSAPTAPSGSSAQSAPASVPTDAETTPAQAPASESPTAPIAVPPKPSRDDANVDARDFEARPGEYYFRSPTGNVWCAIRPNDTTEIANGCQARVSVPGSSGVTCRNADNHAYAVTMIGSDVKQFCTSQGIFSTEDPRTLEYGQTLFVGAYSCSSTEAGIACYGRKGFLLSRDANLILD